jgi:RNA polymerase sigma-70 factor (ECF subfamily)
MTKEEERIILERVKRGDIESYGIIVKKYMKRAYFIALGFTGDPDDALDISQEAFIRAYRSIENFDTTKPFFPWLYQIIKNISIDFKKRKRKRGEIPIEFIDDLGKTEATIPGINQHLLKEKIWKAIEGLPPPEKEVVLLRYFQGLSYKEMSEIMDCPIGTVMSRLYYAKSKLREKLKGFFE